MNDKLTGEPLKKVNLNLVRVNARNPGPVTPSIAASNTEGKFVFRNVEPGEYRLSADRNGFVRTEYGQRQAGRGAQGTTIKLDKGQKLGPLKIEMIPHAILTGRLVDEDGDPVAQAQVMLMRPMYALGRRQPMPQSGASTNDLGEFRLFGLAPGKYLVSAMARGLNWEAGGAVADPRSGGEESYIQTYYPGVTESSAASMVDVPLGGRVQGIDFTVRKLRTYRVTGKVVAPGTSRGRSGPVFLMKREAAQPFQFDRRDGFWRGPAGDFTLRAVQPGSYYVQAYSFDNNERLSARLAIEVTDSNVEGLNLVLSAGADVTGTVRAEGDQPPATEGISVQLRATSMTYGYENSSGRVKADGTFVIPGALREKVWVHAGELPEGYYLKSIRAGDADALAKEVDLSAGAGAQIELTIAPGVAQLEGGVSDAKDKPAAGMTVLAIPVAEELRQRGDRTGRAQTDQTGRFTIRNIAPGEYYVLAIDLPEPGMEQDPEFLKENQGKATKVKFEVGGKEVRELKVIPPAP